MRQSTHIMKQCLDKLASTEGKGPIAVDNTKITPPKRAETKRSMEAMIEQFELYTEGFRVPAARSMPQSKRPRGNLASISSPTEQHSL